MSRPAGIWHTGDGRRAAEFLSQAHDKRFGDRQQTLRTDRAIGANGIDLLDGGNDDDLLVGGFTSYDANRAAYLAILQEWTRADLAYNGRVDHISGAVAGGLNGTFKLNATTVFDDNKAADTMWGRAGTDWFITTANKDNVMDKVSWETITKL